MQSAANRHHSIDVGFGLLLLAAIVKAARTLPSTNQQTANDKENRLGAKIRAALCGVTVRSSIMCFGLILI